MPADFTIAQGDSEPVFARQIEDSSGPVNLTGASVQLILRSLTDPTVKTLTGTVEIFDATNGKVQWHPSTADTATPGMFMGKWLVTWANGEPQSYPTEGYLWVSIEPAPSAVTGALVGLPEVKDYVASFGLGSSSRIHDNKLLGFIQAATPIIENAVGPVVLRTYDEWHDGGQHFIQLRRRPSTTLGTTPVLTIVGCDEYRGPIKYPLSVISDPTQASIYSVMLDQRTGTLYRRTTGGGIIAFGAGPLAGGMPQAVHVVYQAGQATVPANVREATLEAIRVNYETTLSTGTGSRAMADDEDRTGPPLGFYLPRRCMELLSPMRRHPAIA